MEHQVSSLPTAEQGYNIIEAAHAEKDEVLALRREKGAKQRIFVELERRLPMSRR